MTHSRTLAALRRLPLIAVIALFAVGCSRKFFRERADRDVEGLLTDKNNDPRWALDNWHVYPDARARFADFDKPDHPQKPPDDPAAAALSPDPQPIRGYFCQGKDMEGGGYLQFLEFNDLNNRATRDTAKPAALAAPVPVDAAATPSPKPAPAAENPVAPTSFDRALKSEEPAYLITLEQAAELALFNSRDYQDRREDLYLSALPVTQQRFAFVTQFAAAGQAIREATGATVPGGPGSGWSVNTNGGASQLFPTGATLMAQLANRLVVDLSTQRPTVGISNLSLTLTQPFLRGGGWAVTLEPLTQAERNLVYGVRSYARFRKNYYVYLAGGADVGNGPYSYAGLGSRGVGQSLAAPSQGYLPTLLSAAQERNEAENIRTLGKYLDLFHEYQGKGDYSELQVGQVEQQLLRGQSSLLQRRQDLQTGLDQFKLQLGVPTRLQLELDDGPMKPVSDLMAMFGRTRDEFIALREEAEQYPARIRQPLMALAGTTIATVPIDVPLRPKLEALMFESAFVRETKQFRADTATRWERWKKMSAAVLAEDLRARAEEVRNLQLRQAQMEARGEKLPPAEAARLATVPRDMAVGLFEQSLRAYEAARTRKGATARDVAVRYEETVNNFVLVLSEARRERQAQVRAAWPRLPGVAVEGVDLLTDDLDRAQTAAAQAALGNRLDLMNARGQLGDAWRNIAVQANSLLGVFNVGYHYEADSPGGENRPFALGGGRGKHQLVLNGELPLVRRAERNAYRTALIAYQRSRRNLQATEDFILSDVRTDLRALRVLAENYRIQQRAVEVAYDQVENALDVLQAPPTPVGGGGAGGQPGGAAAQSQQSAANAAALTQQLLSAQGSLLQAQNGLYTIWVNYLIARMTLYRDLERLPLDPRGVWIDEHPPLPADGPAVLPAPVDASGGAGPARFADLR